MEEQTKQENNNWLAMTNAQGGQIKTVIGENSKALSEILMANIKRVQDDPNFIPQAKEIRDQVRELSNLARIEVDMVREMRMLHHS